MNAYLIDPEAKTITLVDYAEPEESLDAMYKLLGCDTVTVIYLDDKGTVAFVDDDGLLKNPQHFWRWSPYGQDAQSFADKALVLGTDLSPEAEGNTIGVDLTEYPLAKIQALVSFKHRSELTEREFAPFMHFIQLN